MSLIAYEFTPNVEPIDYTPLMFGMGIALASMLVNASSDENDYADAQSVSLSDASAQTEEPPQIKKKSPSEDPLDAMILDILTLVDKPLTAREIVRLLESADRSQVNSRLYTMYCKKKVKKCDTKGAPNWFI